MRKKVRPAGACRETLDVTYRKMSHMAYDADVGEYAGQKVELAFPRPF